MFRDLLEKKRGKKMCHDLRVCFIVERNVYYYVCHVLKNFHYTENMPCSFKSIYETYIK